MSITCFLNKTSEYAEEPHKATAIMSIELLLPFAFIKKKKKNIRIGFF